MIWGWNKSVLAKIAISYSKLTSVIYSNNFILISFSFLPYFILNFSDFMAAFNLEYFTKAGACTASQGIGDFEGFFQWCLDLNYFCDTEHTICVWKLNLTYFILILTWTLIFLTNCMLTTFNPLTVEAASFAAVQCATLCRIDDSSHFDMNFGLLYPLVHHMCSVLDLQTYSCYLHVE